MKIKLIFKKNSVNKEHHTLIKKFIRFLYEKYKLNNNLMINFVAKREIGMSTGGRRSDSVIFVLCGKRIIRDILRTLAHEWIHEYQLDVLKREAGPNIGGKNEDEANAMSGRLIKMFEKDYPNLEKIMYEHKL